MLYKPNSKVKPELTSQTQSITDKTETQSETEQELAYQKLLESFESLSSTEDRVKREFELVRSARSHKLPIASYRKMYRVWLFQQKGGAR